MPDQISVSGDRHRESKNALAAARAARVRSPPTNWSIILAAGSSDHHRASAALGRLCETYRQPIFHWLRASGLAHHEAEDAVQDLLEHLLRKQRLARVSPHGARFRTYLLAALRHRMEDRRRAQCAAKRGAGAQHVELVETSLPGPELAWDRELDRGFALAVHGRALKVVDIAWSNGGRQERFRGLEPFLLRSPEEGQYAKAGASLGLEARQIKRLVFDLREDYFNAFRAEVVQTVAPEELHGELAYLISLITEIQ